MHPIQHILAVASLFLLTACAHDPQTTSTSMSTARVDGVGIDAGQWLSDVSEMAEADDNTRRRDVIRKRLNTLDVQWRNSRFDTEIEGVHGENILAPISGPAGAPLLLLGAHSDRVDVGRGATDNASGTATVLALAKRFKHRPLIHHRVSVALWDLEEHGLLGAHAYIGNGGERPALYVNFDVFGWGDTLWMMTPQSDHPLVSATQSAVNEAGLGLSAGEQYPPTDHRAFLEASWPAVSFSLVDGDEIDLILQAYAGKQPATKPKVMQVIHSERDTIAEINADAAARGVDAVEAALRRWDAASAVP